MIDIIQRVCFLGQKNVSANVLNRLKFGRMSRKDLKEFDHTPNANMADHLVGARDESHESKAS